jgi:hypothetical protein
MYNIIQNTSIINLLLIIFFSIFMTLILLISFYDNIKMSVIKNSRCKYYKGTKYKNKEYIVAKDNTDQKLFKITYDLQNKSSELTCACSKGIVVNKFKEIQLYAFDGKPTKYVDKECLCNTDLSTSQKQYYGNPKLVRYMYNKNDTDAFDEAYKD